MKEIVLSRGFVVRVDDEDFELVCRFTWWACKNGRTWYARTQLWPSGKFIRMHILIMGKRGIDHRDCDGLNNQRSNLRMATSGENGRNKRPRLDCSSAFKGVTHRPSRGKWQAEITKARTKIDLGLFDTEIAAVQAYNDAAKEMHGEFARLNEIAA